jgi:hypothetical protein
MAPQAQAAAASPAQRFRDNCAVLAKFCSSIITELRAEKLTELDPTKIQLGLLVIEQFSDADLLIETFINASSMYWNQIYHKDEQFFLQNVMKIFPDWDPSLVNMFRELFVKTRPDGRPLITPDQKEYIWKVFQSLVKISLHYVSEQREAYMAPGGTIKWRDDTPFLQVTDLPKLVQQWGIQKNLRLSNA